MAQDPISIAACLRLDESTIRQLQARGHLLRFDLTEIEVRQLLYDAHLAHCLRDRPISAGQSSGNADAAVPHIP